MNDSSIHPEWENDLKAPAPYTRFFMDDKDELKTADAQPVSAGTAEPLATDTDRVETEPESRPDAINDEEDDEEEGL